GTAEAGLWWDAHVVIATMITVNARTTANLNPRLSGSCAICSPRGPGSNAPDVKGRNRERCVNYFTLARACRRLSHCCYKVLVGRAAGEGVALILLCLDLRSRRWAAAASS